MTYDTIKPPFTLDFTSMDEREVRRYFDWFVQLIPSRLNELEAAVSQSAPWHADFAKDSLEPLGEWFAREIELRPMTKEEQQEIIAQSRYQIDVPTEQLTDRTISLAVDIGMYLGETLTRHDSSLRWEPQLGDKRNVDYGQPVVVGPGPVPLNPVGVVVTLAYGLSRGKKTGKRLAELHDIWLADLRGSSRRPRERKPSA